MKLCSDDKKIRQLILLIILSSYFDILGNVILYFSRKHCITPSLRSINLFNRMNGRKPNFFSILGFQKLFLIFKTGLLLHTLTKRNLIFKEPHYKLKDNLLESWKINFMFYNLFYHFIIKNLWDYLWNFFYSFFSFFVNSTNIT